MSDEQQSVDAGSETSGEQATDTASQETASTETETAQTDSTTEASQDAGAQDAGSAADETKESDAAVDPNESRTGFVTGARQGDECVCPDGRKGTVHTFDTGLVCIPNHDQN